MLLNIHGVITLIVFRNGSVHYKAVATVAYFRLGLLSTARERKSRLRRPACAFLSVRSVLSCRQTFSVRKCWHGPLGGVHFVIRTYVVPTSAYILTAVILNHTNSVKLVTLY